MTKKHYAQLAEILKAANEMAARPNSDAKLIVRHVTRRVTDLCHQDNPSFDAARFLLACGIDD